MVLEQFSPLERAVFLLHEVFDSGHQEIADIIERTPQALRKLLERAKKQLQEHRPRFAPSKEAYRALVEAFAKAVAAGDAAALTAILDPNVGAESDGGEKANAARRPMTGVEDVVRLFANLARFATPEITFEILELNGWPPLMVRAAARAFSAPARDRRAAHSRRSLHPEPRKLTRL